MPDFGFATAKGKRKKKHTRTAGGVLAAANVCVAGSAAARAAVTAAVLCDLRWRQARLHAWQRRADAARPPPARLQRVGQQHARFRHAIALQQRLPCGDIGIECVSGRKRQVWLKECASAARHPRLRRLANRTAARFDVTVLCISKRRRVHASQLLLLLGMSARRQRGAVKR